MGCLLRRIRTRTRTTGLITWLVGCFFTSSLETCVVAKTRQTRNHNKLTGFSLCYDVSVVHVINVAFVSSPVPSGWRSGSFRLVASRSRISNSPHQSIAFPDNFIYAALSCILTKCASPSILLCSPFSVLTTTRIRFAVYANTFLVA